MSKRNVRNGSHIYRSRKDMKEGPLGEIWLNFFAPLLSDSNNVFETREGKMYFIELLFGGREIYSARSKRNFNCPGGFISSLSLPDTDGFNYSIKKDSRIWVRTDDLQDIVDVETDDGRVFRMSKKQYKEIERYIAREQ